MPRPTPRKKKYATPRKKKHATSKRPSSKRPSSKRPTKKSSVRRPIPKRRPTAPKPTAPSDGKQRLQKVLAAAGFGSRRECEELILAGRVEVDRKVVTEMGTKVDPQTQEVRFDGETLSKPKLVYYAVYKPDGVISTNSDPAGRPRVIDLLPNQDVRMFTVGRLDLHSEGLILLTNDGELANRLTHPRYEIEKLYLVQIAGHPERETLEQIRKGVYLSEGMMRVEGVRVKRKYKQSTFLEMRLNEGRNREIRRVLAKVGHKVQRLTRIAVGPIRLGKMTPGECRKLTHTELMSLRNAAGLSDKTAPRRHSKRATKKK